MANYLERYYKKKREFTGWQTLREYGFKMNKIPAMA